MAKRFSAQHTKNGYAAMGGNSKRPRISGSSHGTVADAIAAERAKAACMAAIKKKK